MEQEDFDHTLGVQPTGIEIILQEKEYVYQIQLLLQNILQKKINYILLGQEMLDLQ